MNDRNTVPGKQKGQKVLIVDDFPSGRKLLASMVNAAGFVAEEAGTFEECLRKAEGGVDLILLDTLMPDRDGFAILSELREKPSTRAIPVILHAASVHPSLIQRAALAGAEAVVEKPLNMDELYHTISHCLAKAGKLAPEQVQAELRDDETDEQIKVAFLAKLLNRKTPVVSPLYDAQSLIGYIYPEVLDHFQTRKNMSYKALEEFANDGILERKLFNKVHLCPRCSSHTLNFRETCAQCKSIDIHIEEVIHHFACAYVGPISEYEKGMDLVCPKCNEELRHIGLDYEKPSQTYLCRSCGYIFNDSHVQMQCFSCGYVAPAEEAVVREIYEYRPTPKATRAVESGRVYGLDIEPLLLDSHAAVYRKEFLDFELRKEFHRARRYEEPLSLILFSISGLEKLPRVHAPEKAQDVTRELFRRFNEILRPSDVLSLCSPNEVAVLLPNTPLPGAEAVARKLSDLVTQSQALNMGGNVKITLGVVSLLDAHESGSDLLRLAREALHQARSQGDGTCLVLEHSTKEQA